MNISHYLDSDLLVIENKIFQDERGLFSETFNEALFRLKTGLNIQFVQDNESISFKNVFRGFHFQTPPKSQSKLIRVVHGSIIDFAIDLRAFSNKLGCVYSIELTGENKKQFYIPEGFAHGFIALQDDTIVNYKCSQYYSPESERSLLFSDPNLNIDWPVPFGELIISEKDRKGQFLKELSDIFI